MGSDMSTAIRIVPAALTVLASVAMGEEGYTQGRAGWGAFVVPVPLSVQAQNDLLPGQGGLVLFVRPGGTAAALGVQPGEVVVSINQNPIGSRRDVRDVMSTVAPGDAATVTVIGDDGQTRDAGGEFLARLPRRRPAAWIGGQEWNPAAGADQMRWARDSSGDPQQLAQEQREELIRERDQLRVAEKALQQARAALPADDGSAWFMHIDFHGDVSAREEKANR